MNNGELMGDLMMIKKYLLPVVLLAANVAQAEEITLSNVNNVGMNISIYNQNLALIKDTRSAVLIKGVNEVAFEGVASQIKPETALLSADSIAIMEQNYEYDLLNANNILEKSIGQKVKTVMINPANGKNIFDEAVLLNSSYGAPILQFGYGVESNFPGRVVVKDVPAGLRVKPTLSVKLDSAEATKKDLELNYLTNGLSWQADYVAEITSNDKLNWQAWVTINNQSGAAYKNAMIQLIAGDVQQEVDMPQPRAYNLTAKSARGMAMDAAMPESVSIMPQALSAYYIYDLPNKANLEDQQTKQISLLGMQGVKYERVYKLSSPLYLGKNLRDSEFEKANPQVFYKLVNSKEDNLGVPMPAGTVRFYEKDAKEALQFVGASKITQLAVGEKTELTIGNAFDIFAKGKITKAQSLSDKMVEATVEITLNNAKAEDVVVEFEQNFNGKVEVVKESLPSKQEKAGGLQWEVKIPANGETILEYNIRLTVD